MQIVFSPYNVYRWCISRGLLPEGSCLIFGESTNEQEEDNDDIVKIVVDLMADEEKQTCQVLSAVAVYNLLSGKSCAASEIHKEVEQRFSVYFQQWVGDVGSNNEEDRDWELDYLEKVVHPTLVMLAVLDDQEYIKDKDVIVMGDIEADTIGKTLSIQEKLYWQQLKVLLQNLKNNDMEKAITAFLIKWEALKRKFTNKSIKIPEFTREKIISFVNK